MEFPHQQVMNEIAKEALNGTGHDALFRPELLKRTESPARQQETASKSLPGLTVEHNGTVEIKDKSGSIRLIPGMRESEQISVHRNEKEAMRIDANNGSAFIKFENDGVRVSEADLHDDKFYPSARIEKNKDGKLIYKELGYEKPSAEEMEKDVYKIFPELSPTEKQVVKRETELKAAYLQANGDIKLLLPDNSMISLNADGSRVETNSHGQITKMIDANNNRFKYDWKDEQSTEPCGVKVSLKVDNTELNIEYRPQTTLDKLSEQLALGPIAGAARMGSKQFNVFIDDMPKDSNFSVSVSTGVQCDLASFGIGAGMPMQETVGLEVGKDGSLKILRTPATASAKINGMTIEDVHQTNGGSTRSRFTRDILGRRSMDSHTVKDRLGRLVEKETN